MSNPPIDEIHAFLIRRGWEHYPTDGYTDEAWLLPGRIQFEGDNCTSSALQWQLEQDREAKKVSE